MSKQHTRFIQCLTIFIALIGGVPGSINVYKFFMAKPRLCFEVKAAGSGKYRRPEAERESALLYLYIMIANKGDKPLLPASFQFEINHNNEWFSLENMAIPNEDTTALTFRGTEMRTAEYHTKDVHKYVGCPITNHIAFIGNAMFLLDDKLYNIISLRKPLAIRLICKDVYGKKHVARSTLFSNDWHSINRSEWGTELPAAGIVVPGRAEDSGSDE